jgi:hypothetical protein
LLFTDDPVFLKRLAAPECVFNLYPIYYSYNLTIYLFFFRGDKTISNCLPSSDGSWST